MRPPSATSNKVVTTSKIRRIGQHKKTTDNKPRDNFKSPAAVRKAPLISSQNKNETLRNNVSANRATRRTRMERKATIEEVQKLEDQQVKTPITGHYKRRYEAKDQPHEHEDSRNIMSNTLTSELQEMECPTPTPVPERFAHAVRDHDFNDFDKYLRNVKDRPDLVGHDAEDEAEFDFNEEGDSVINKLPTERQSITNSKVFSMSETDFQRFDANNGVSGFIEVSNEEEYPPHADDINKESCYS
jgi:hypothetical protein